MHPEDESRYVYLLHGYEVRMRQEAETWADAVVIIAGGLEIPETMHSVRVTGDRSMWWLSRSRPLGKTLQVGKRRPVGEGNVVSYHHLRATLVHSPRVRQVYESLDTVQGRAIAELNAVVARLTVDGYGSWVRRSAAEVADLINDFAFLEASAIVELASVALPSGYRTQLEKLGGALATGDLILTTMRWSGPEERALLVAYLGVDPFVSKRKMQKLQRQAEAEQRLRELRKRPWGYRGGTIL